MLPDDKLCEGCLQPDFCREKGCVQPPGSAPSSTAALEHRAVYDIIFKHRRHVELSPGAGAAEQAYALAVIDDIESDLRRTPLSAIALPVMELRAAALGLLQAWNKSEREGISVAEMAKARQRVDAAIRATAPSHTAPEAKERDPDALKKRQQPCTCTGACRGPEGLGEGWVCAMGRTVSPRVPKDGAV